jgi:hypothetical protein
MLRTCVHPATESLEEIRTHRNVDTTIDFCIPWECVKLATSLIIIKEERRSKEKSSLLSNNLVKLPELNMAQRLTVKAMSPSTVDS